MSARRQAIAEIRDLAQVRKLFDVIGPRYKERNGGYTRIMKAGFRYGDNAAQAVIEFVDRDEAAKGLDSGPVQEKKADGRRKPFRPERDDSTKSTRAAAAPPFLFAARFRRRRPSV